MACVAGEGRVLLDGRWQIIRAGTVCMAPPRVLNAFAAVSGHRWSFVWVRFDEPTTVVPLVGADSPVRVRSEAGEFRRVVEGLRAEWEGARDPRALHHWIGLLHLAVRRLAQPWQGRTNERLQRLWTFVGADLAADWTLEALASRCHMSKENLRRVCLRELGRSPMQHLTYMRLQRAQELLESTRDKLEVVAHAVGYDSGLVFSRAFKRWVGFTPSEYRGQGAERRGPASGEPGSDQSR
jgi:AraC-like DNA-binding protein